MLDNGQYVHVELQVVPQNFWENRALAYASSKQITKGGSWSKLRIVISINILGGGRNGIIMSLGLRERFHETDSTVYLYMVNHNVLSKIMAKIALAVLVFSRCYRETTNGTC